MAKKNENKPAEEVSKETVQPEGTNPKDETIEVIQKTVAEQRKKFNEEKAKLESYYGELQDKAAELDEVTKVQEVQAEKLIEWEERIAKYEANLKDWATELGEKAKKGKGKASKEDGTYAKKLSNCFLNGSVEEYIRTSAEQFEGEARHNFLNAIIEGSEAVKANT